MTPETSKVYNGILIELHEAGSCYFVTVFGWYSGTFDTPEEAFEEAEWFLKEVGRKMYDA